MVTPSSKQLKIEILPKDTRRGGDYEEVAESTCVDNIDTTAVRARIESVESMVVVRDRSYVDPELTSAQKKRIKANECRNARFAGLSRAKVKNSVAFADWYEYPSLTRYMWTLPRRYG